MTEALTLRATTRADLTRIDALLSRTYPALLKHDYPPSLLVTAIPLISRAQPALVASGRYFAVLTPDDEIVGAGGVTISAPPGRPARRGVGHIRHVVTDHRRTRQGIGRALMEHIFATAKDDGMSTLECLSTLTAVPFYAACGFSRVAPVTVPLRPGIDFPVILMQRSI